MKGKDYIRIRRDLLMHFPAKEATIVQLLSDNDGSIQCSFSELVCMINIYDYNSVAKAVMAMKQKGIIEVTNLKHNKRIYKLQEEYMNPIQNKRDAKKIRVQKKFDSLPEEVKKHVLKLKSLQKV